MKEVLNVFLIVHSHIISYQSENTGDQKYREESVLGFGFQLKVGLVFLPLWLFKFLIASGGMIFPLSKI